MLSRRTKVAALALRGITNQFDICERLGMDRSQNSTISRDLKAIREEWKQSAVRDFDEAKGKELARLDAVEREAWEAWERSKVQRETTRTKRRTGDTLSDEAELKKESRDGDPRFLAMVIDCVDKRCELLGLVVKGKDEQNSAPPIFGFRLVKPAEGNDGGNSGPIAASG